MHTDADLHALHRLSGDELHAMMVALDHVCFGTELTDPERANIMRLHLSLAGQ